MKVTTCPDLAQFQLLATGQLPTATKEALLEHLEGCDACAQRIESLPQQDTLVELVRQVRTLGEGPTGEHIARLVEQFGKLRPGATPPPAEERTLPPAEGAAPAPPLEPWSMADARTSKKTNPGATPDDTQLLSGNEEDLLACLAPPQTPDELGRLGPYRVLKVLGQGGMGVVFEAEDPHLQRRVALKVMLPQLAVGVTMRQRFLREARAAAAIEHDHIVPIYQVGEDRGVPFVAMPLLKGEALDGRLQREGKLPMAEVLRIGREAAEGLAAAHERGLVHRDIKPANIWLEGSRGRVKILDFGLARAVADNTQLTQQGAVVGTPAYMAPEQATNNRPVDARCDLFSLGCVLYRLATGEQPFKGTDTISTLMAVATENPPAPALRNFEVPAALSDFILKLLAKKPEERPASARAVVEALAALEADRTQPLPSQLGTVPRPDRAPPRRRLWVAAAVLLGLVGGGILLGQIIIRIRDKEGRETKIEVPPGSTVTVEEGGKEVAKVPDKAGKLPDQPKPVPPVVESARPASPFDALRREKIPAYELAAAGGGDPKQAPAELVAILGDSRLKHWGAVAWLGFMPQGKTLVSGSSDGTMKLWDVAKGQEQLTLKPEGGVGLVGVSPDGRMVIAAGKVWDATTGKELRAPPQGTSFAAFSPDGKTIAAIRGKDVVIWDATTWKEQRELKSVTFAAFSPDGQTLATYGSDDNALRLWDVATGIERRSIKEVRDPQVAFDPQGKILAVSGGGIVKLLDLSTGEERHSLLGPNAVRSLAFHPDGRMLASGYDDGLIKFWDVMTGKELHTLKPPAIGRCYALAFSPDGKILASGAGDDRGFVRLWDVATKQQQFKPQGHTEVVHCMAISPDGKTVATGSSDHTVKLWDVASGSEQRTLKATAEVGCVAFSPDGKTLASENEYGTVKLWDTATGGERRTIKGHPGAWVTCVGFTDGKTLASASGDGTVKLWDVETGDERRTFRGAGMTLSRDGVLMFTFDRGSTVTLWDVSRREERRTFTGLRQGHAIAISPDGTLLAMTGEGGIKLCDVATGEELRTLRGHVGTVQSLAFSPDGKTIASSDDAGTTVRLWDVNAAPGRPLLRQTLTLGPSRGNIRQVAFSPEGRHLLTRNSNGTIYVLRLASPPASK